VQKVEAAFKEELAKLIAEGFNAAEVDAAKIAFLQDRQVGRTADGSLAGLFVSQAELGRTMQRDIDLENAIRNATLEQLHQAFVKWIKPDSISYFKAGDFKKAGITQ
jgi:zinc protease